MKNINIFAATRAAAVIPAAVLMTGCQTETNMELKNYQLPQSSRQQENIEWSVSYSYNAPDKKSPRVLLIGDSIFKAAHVYVRKQLNNTANISFWSTSKCVSDPAYLRELDFVTDAEPISMIFFNNGIHAITSNRSEWQTAYANTVRFLRDKFPGTPLILVLSTPSRKQELTDAISSMNQWIVEFAKQENLQVLDLFSPVIVQKKEAWIDDYHFQQNIFEMLAKHITAEVIKELPAGDKIEQKSSLTGPDGILK